VSTRAGAVGFTLLELLVALALFALVAAMSFGGLSAMVRTQDGRLASLQLAIGLIERDLRQATLRPIRDGQGQVRAALVGQSRAIELTALANASPLVLTRPSLQRLGYTLDRKRLTRFTYAVLDRAPSSQPQGKALLDDVEEFGLRYLGREQQWLDAWPPPKAGAEERDALPRAVELRLQVAGYGTVHRVFLLPDVLLPPANAGGPGAVPPGLIR
jgi:general secretion pathway protein J